MAGGLLLRLLPLMWHFGIASFDVALMIYYHGKLPLCPDQLRGWIYGQFLIHLWAGFVAAGRECEAPSRRDFGQSLLYIFIFVWLIYAMIVGYQTIGCANVYPVLYFTVVMGAVALGFKAARDCKAHPSRSSRPLLSVGVVPRPVPYSTVHDAALNDKCSFCMEEFESTDMVVALPCKHVYHPQVIRVWLSTRPTCPLCRKTVEVRCPGV